MNPHKGEVSFEASGKLFTFKLGTNTLAAIEKREGMPFFKFFSRKPEEWTVADILSIFYCGLYRKYELTEDQVGDIIDELGQVRVGEIIAEAMVSAFGREDASGKQNPTAAVTKLRGGVGTA